MNIYIAAADRAADVLFCLGEWGVAGWDPAGSFVTLANYMILLTLSLLPGNMLAGAGVSDLHFNS